MASRWEQNARWLRQPIDVNVWHPMPLDEVVRHIDLESDCGLYVGRVRSAATALLVVQTLIHQRQQRRTVGLVRGARLHGFFTVPHEHANHFMPLLQEQVSCDAAIHAARHC